MSAVTFTYATVFLRLQVRIALLVPLIATRVIAPGDPSWAIASVAGVTIFTLFYRRSWQVWLIPASAVVASVPQVPTWVAVVFAVGCGVYLTINPPPPATAKRPAILWVISILLRVLAIAVIALALLAVMREDRDFAEAQSDAAEAWNAPLIEVPADAGGTVVVPESAPASSGDAAPAPRIAAVTFSRPGSDRAPVTTDTLFIRPGVSEADLKKGPGLYPGSAAPGQLGNIAIAGHRTGWGAPFADLDELEPGDRVSVEDPQGAVFDYEVTSVAYVRPDEVWVLGPDPLETGLPTLTLTTCDPPGVNTRRLVVWATLVGSTPA